jgi:hypothetical protein
LGLGGLIFPSPDRRVKRIPITPGVLIEAIRTQKWPSSYPDHALPKVRWDLRVNQVLVLLLLELLALWAWEFVRWGPRSIGRAEIVFNSRSLP